MVALSDRAHMSRIHAELLLAVVMNVTTLWNGADELFVEPAMSTELLELDSEHRVLTSEPKLPHPARSIESGIDLEIPDSIVR